MRNKPIKNIEESVKRRLINQAKSKGVDPNDMWIRYGMERFLYRLGESKYNNMFTLKGALLFHVWFGEGQRSTKDIDLRGEGDPSVEHIEKIIKDICNLKPEFEDGLTFKSETVISKKIKEGMKYEGVRVNFHIYLGKIRIPMQIDVGFGDIISKEVQLEELPTYLDMPAPKIKIYPKETVIAEKFEAMVKLDIENTRLKDFYDVWKLSKEFEFSSEQLIKAITLTFEKRETEIPKEVPTAFTEAFYQNQKKLMQWRSFLKKTRADTEKSFEEVCLRLNNFLFPLIQAINEQQSFNKKWNSESGWQDYP